MTTLTRRAKAAAQQRSTLSVVAFAVLAISTPVAIGYAPNLETQLIIVVGLGAMLSLLVLSLRLVAFGLLCVAFAMGPMNSLRVAPFVTYGDAALAAAILVSILGSGWVLRRIWLPTSYLVGSAILLMSGLISSFLASSLDSLGNLALLVFAAIGLPFLGAVWRPSLAEIHLLCLSYLVGESMSVGYALLVPVNQSTGRALGFSLKSNHFGLAAAFGVGLAVFLFFSARGWIRRLGVAMGVLAAAGVFVSGSRAALIGVLAMVLAMAVVLKAWKTTTLAAITAATLLVAQDLLLAVVPPGSSLYRLIIGDESSAQSDANRLDVLNATFASFLDNPLFGRGFENSLEAHNIYLQVAAAAGVFGFIGFVLILITAVSPILRADIGATRWLALPPIGYAVAGLVANTLWDRFVWVLVGLAVLSLPRPGLQPGISGVSPPTEPAGDPAPEPVTKPVNGSRFARALPVVQSRASDST